MSRSTRLFELMQALRRHRLPVGGAALASSLGISLRTLYRDIATLQAQGADINGAPGLGYVLRPGFTLPPLMFSVDELQALALGSRWVAQRSDTHLAAAANEAMVKIAAVLPPALRHELDSAALLAGPEVAPPSKTPSAGDAQLPTIRMAIRCEQPLRMGYGDAAGQSSRRTVWPIALGYFDRCQVVVAWCTLRQALRHFRTDRISALQLLPERYPQRRHALLKVWREEQGLRAE